MYVGDVIIGKDLAKTQRSGTFTDNMKLPVHRWFRYSAGFSAEWAENIIQSIYNYKPNLIYDPFMGSGTVSLASDNMGVLSIGTEAHPFVARIAKAKLLWATPTIDFETKASIILQRASNIERSIDNYPDLIKKCFTKESLHKLDSLSAAWMENNDHSPASELVWLAITSILRPTSFAGTAQWQYILPDKPKKKAPISPIDAFQKQVNIMIADMRYYQEQHTRSLSTIIEGDARYCPQVANGSVDLVITSPPYANNYDYADATRFEMSFWKLVHSWGNLHQAVRSKLIVSSSQHASSEKLILDEIINLEILKPIKEELSLVCKNLANERLLHGGKKHYHTMIASYFASMAKVWIDLRRVCIPGAKVCFVIGDSAPYGIYVPVDTWLGALALAAGFTNYKFEKIRDRNVKWKNRKHRVPLNEGFLWVNG